MKTKFKVELHKQGCHTDFLIGIICNHNQGISNIDLDVITGYMMARKAQYPSGDYGKLSLKTEGDNNQTIHISDDDGESYYLSITECEMEELREEVELPDYMKVPKMEF